MTTSEQAVTRALHEAIAEILPGLPAGQITNDKHLKELGADSVDRVEIILRVTALLGVDQALSAFGRLPTIGALIEYLVSVRRTG